MNSTVGVAVDQVQSGGIRSAGLAASTSDAATGVAPGFVTTNCQATSYG